MPNLITQELISLSARNDQKPHFWVREKKQSAAEVDLVYTFGGKVIPIEIKSGKEGTLKSLHQFVDSVDHYYAVRMYAGEFAVNELKTPGGKRYLLMNLPYYLGTKIPDYIEFFTQEFSL